MRSSALKSPAARFARSIGLIAPLIAALLGINAAAGAPLPAGGVVLPILDNRLPVGVVNTPYAYFALTATGGTGSYTFSITGGTLPAGMTMDSTGLFQGSPGAVGSYPLIFQVIDTGTGFGSKSLTLTVNPPPSPPLWTVRGLTGGSLRDIRVSPGYASDATLFATGYSNEVNRSTDQGGTWSRVIVNPNNPGQVVDALELSPAFDMNSTASEEAQTLFVATGGGMYKSADHGGSYSFVGATLPDGAARLALSPNYLADHTVFVAGYQQSGIGTRIYRSVDRGLSYSLIATLPALVNGAQQIAVSPNYSADQTLFLIGANNSGVYRSLSGGTSWSVVYTLPPAANYPIQIAISPDYATDQTLFVAGNYNIYRSVNGGASFALNRYWTVGMLGMAMVKRPAQTPLLYYMTYDTPQYMIFMSDDYGATAAQQYSGGVRFPAYLLSASPLLAGGLPDLYVGSSFGVDLSHDGGFSFSSRDRGLNAFVFGNLSGAVDGAGATIIAGGENGWFKSSNSGAGWVRMKPPPSTDTYALYATISPNYAADSSLFITNTQEVFRSVDGGVSFTQVLSLAPAYYYTGFAVATDFNPASGVVLAGSQFAGLYRSGNGGQNFTLVTGGGGCPLTTSSTVTSAAFSPNFSADNTVFITAGPDSSTAKLCKSTDRGLTWTLLRATQTHNVSLSPVYNNGGANGLTKMLIVSDASNFYQLIRSLDGGATFTGTGSYANAVASYSPNFTSDGTILVDDYYGTNGIFRSSDSGASFAPLGAGDPLGIRLVSGIYLTPGFNGNNLANSVAIASTQGSGMWKSTDGGRSFNPVLGYETISPALNALARGPGGAPSTPILAATGDQGVFRSTDDGATFSNISVGLPPDADARAITVPSAAPAAPVTAIGAQGLYRYNGSAWSSVSGAASGSFTSFLEFPQPVSGNYLYATRADGTSLRSGDNGATWSAQDAAQPNLVNIDFNSQSGPTLQQPANKSPGAVAVNTAALWAVAQSGGARYSTNSGATWIAAVGSGDYALPAGASYTTVRALGINAVSGSREVMVGSTTSLYRTTDGGMNWRSVSGTGSGLEATSKNFSAFVTSTTQLGATDLLAGITGALTGGVYLSGDGGEHWTQVNQGFDPNSLDITTLIKTSCAGCPVQYYSGTYGSGVFTRTIPVVAPPAITSWCFGSTGCACGTAAMSGPEQGNVPFHLCGSNFQNPATIEFDGVAASGCAFASSSAYTCTGTPAHLPATVALRLRNPDTRAGYANQNYSYTSGAPRAITLTKISKTGVANRDALVAWSCGGGACAGLPVQLYRSQNVAFTLNLEHTPGTAGVTGTVTDPGTLAAGTNPSYFWKME
jgi:photosystem II stability/assembly factor-like uncharacterized protein